MRRSVSGVAAALMAGCAGLAFLAVPPAHAATTGNYYLALGDSLAAGYQPTTGDNKTGGYAGAVLKYLQASDPAVTLTNLGCSGETTTTLLDGGKCQTFSGSANQLAAAQAFLKAHAAETGVITLDIGANDVAKCATSTGIDFPCVLSGLATVQKNLPTIVGALRTAAPNAQIVVLNYYNPFLASWLTGASGQSLAKASAGLQTQLNSIVAGAAGAAKAKVADVSTAFKSDDFTDTVDVSPYGTLPVNVANICDWTWMCKLNNIHTNDAGYAVLAKAVEAQLMALTPPAPTTTATSPSSSSSSSVSSSSASAPGSTSTVSGPPVVTDGPAEGSNDSLLVGAGALAGAALIGGGVLGRRLRR